MRDEQRQVEHRDGDSPSAKSTPLEKVGDRRATEDCADRRRRRSEKREAERGPELGIDRQLPNAGHAASADETDEGCHEKEQEQRGE
jgi:hypothetical protein